MGLNSWAEQRDAHWWLWSKMSDLMEAGVSSFFSTMDRDTYERGQDQRTGSTLSCPIWLCVRYISEAQCVEKFQFSCWGLVEGWWHRREAPTLEDARSICWNICPISLCLWVFFFFLQNLVFVNTAIIFVINWSVVWSLKCQRAVKTAR